MEKSLETGSEPGNVVCITMASGWTVKETVTVYANMAKETTQTLTTKGNGSQTWEMAKAN